MAITTLAEKITQNGTALTFTGVFITADTDTAASATPIAFASDVTSTINGKTYTGLRIRYIGMSSYQQVATYVPGGCWYIWQQPQVSSDAVPIFGVQHGHCATRDFTSDSINEAYCERSGSLHNINLQYKPSESGATANIDYVSIFIEMELV